MKSNNKKNAYNICFMGASMDTGNRGVSALAASIIKIVNRIKPEATVSFFIGNRSSKPQHVRLANVEIRINVFNYRLSPKAKLNQHLFWIFFLSCLQRFVPVKLIRKKIIQSNPFLQGMDQSDFVGDINGGDSFSDIYGVRKLINRTIPSVIALLLNKKLILLPQTYGPFSSSIGKQIARFILRRSELIISRDKESINLIKRITKKEGLKSRVIFCPDVAFMLDSIKPDRVEIQPSIEKDNSKSIIGLNLNGLMYHGGYTRDNMFGLKFEYDIFIHKLVLKLLQKTGARILLVPHTYGRPGSINSDPDASRDVINRLPELYRDRVHMVMQEYDQSELKGIISACDFFIGSRMHACIAALSQGIPTVAIAYSKKFAGVFNSIESGSTVANACKLDEKAVINKILKCYENRNELRIDAKAKVAEAQARIVDVFTGLILK